MRIVTVVFFICTVNSVFSQIDTITWEKKTSLPDSLQRTECGYFLIDSDFYVAGGQSGNSFSCISTVWKYHIPSNTWVQLKSLPFGPASTESSFVINGKGYFLTAYDSVSNYNCDTMLWEYNPIGDSWIRRANFPDAPRTNSSSFECRNKGYVACTAGCTPDDNHLWQYDPAANLWTQMATLPDVTASGRAATATQTNIAYFIDGTTLLGGFTSDFLRYDVINNSWSNLGQMPGSPRAYSVLWDFDSVLISGGGGDGITMYNDFYKYDISHNSWTPIVFKNSFDSTGGGAAFIFNKRGYYFGGYASINPNITFNNYMWSFDASKFFPPDTSVGIANVKSDVIFSVYPNPINREQGFSISTSESGSILFYDALGRGLDERKLMRGLNQIKLTTDNEVVFYRATLQDGTTGNGKVVFIK